VSCLVIFWVFLRPISNVVRYTSLEESCFITFLCFTCSGLHAMAPSLNINNWQLGYLMIRATPLGYIHTFVAGISCARIFVLTCMQDAETLGPVTAESRRVALDIRKAPCILRFGCCIGYLMYVLIVTCCPDHWFDQSTRAFYFLHGGGVIPIMALVLLGAAAGVDPLAEWIFKSKPLLILGRISYQQYLFQRVIWDIMEANLDMSIYKWWYPFVLIAWAYVFERFVDAPITGWLRSHFESNARAMVTDSTTTQCKVADSMVLSPTVCPDVDTIQGMVADHKALSPRSYLNFRRCELKSARLGCAKRK